MGRNKKKKFKAPAKKREGRTVKSLDELKFDENKCVDVKTDKEIEKDRANSLKNTQRTYLVNSDEPVEFFEQNSDIQDNFKAKSPYNFVPLNKKVVSFEKPLDFDQYYTNNYTGYISLYISTLTPTYIRDTLSENELDEKEKNTNSNFFSPSGTPQIPGSSLRGMLQTLVEIISYSKFEKFEGEKKFHFRAFADKSLDLRKKYSDLMITEKEGGYTQDINAGYLVRENNDYKIIPAKEINGMQFFRVEEDLVIKNGVLDERMNRKFRDTYKENMRYKKGFKPVKFIADKPKVHSHTRALYYAKVTNIVNENETLANSLEGTLVHTGWMRGSKKKPRGKHLHWVIGPEEEGKKLSLAKGVLQNYKDDINKSEDSDLLKYFNKDPKKKVPCFYIEENNQVISFGYTGLFRLAYKYAIKDFIYSENVNFDGFDLTTLLFGNTSDFASRVFFEDSKLNGDVNNVFLEENYNKILSSPKPTSFQLYLTQNKFNIEINHENGSIRKIRGLKNYNDKGKTVIRGNKLYWHRKSSNTNWIANQNEVAEHPTQYVVKIKPVKPNTKFKSKIRFENLTEIELGALLFALDLPKGLAHKIGMGKPLGLGSIRITPSLHISNRKERYTILFAEWNGIKESDRSEIERLKSKFEKHILKEIGETNKNSLWDVERIKELKTMLDFENKPDNIKTEYMDMNDKPNPFAQRKVLPKPSKV